MKTSANQTRPHPPPFKKDLGLPIEFDCPHCGRTLRVNDKFAGQSGKCPACQKALVVPEELPEFELLPEDHSTYEVQIIPEKPARSELRSLPDDRATAAMPARNEPTSSSGDDGDSWLQQRLASMHREPEKEPWWKRQIIGVFGLSITPVWLLLIPAVLLGVYFWYVTGPGQPAFVASPQMVQVVRVLDTAEIQMPTRPGGGTTGLPIGGLNPATASASAAPSLSVGGSDELIVTRPDNDGEFVLLNVKLKQGTLNNLGQFQRYDTVIDPAAFELRKRSDPAGSGVAPRLITDDFNQPVTLDLGGAGTTNYQAMLPPVSEAKPDRLDEEKSPGSVRGEAEYAFGATTGLVSFQASRASYDAPASPGLYGTGTLTTKPTNGGPEVVADYQGSQLNVSWDSQSTGHWVRGRDTQPTATSPWTRHEFSLLFPRPAESGTYSLTLAGEEIATVKLPRAKQPNAPAPSPIASARPGGPAPASKHASGPMAYFDVLRDARSQAKGIVSANNMRQIGFALQSYLNDHRGKFPESLLELRPYLPSIEQLLINPRTGENPGFIYEPPPPGAAAGTTPVLFEALGGAKDPTGAVLYADGSIR